MLGVDFDSVFCETFSSLSHALMIWISAMILFILENFTFLESQNNSFLLDIRSRHWKCCFMCLSHTVGILGSLVTWPAILNQMLGEDYWLYLLIDHFQLLAQHKYEIFRAKKTWSFHGTPIQRGDAMIKKKYQSPLFWGYQDMDTVTLLMENVIWYKHSNRQFGNMYQKPQNPHISSSRWQTEHSLLFLPRPHWIKSIEI